MKLNTFESELSGWTIVIFAITTSGLLFYHMTGLKSLHMRPTHASILAIVLLMTAIVYSIYALYNFYIRTGLLLIEQKNDCTRQMVNKSRIVYTIMTGVICLVLALICIQILYNSAKYF
jgi:hypothetical protein